MRIAVTAHKNMDMDSLGAIIAVREIYPQADVFLPNTLGSDVRMVLRENPKLLVSAEKPQFDKLIVVDTNSIQRIPDIVRDYIRNNEHVQVEVYDHHNKNSDLKRAVVHYKKCGAVTSLLTLMLKAKHIIPSPLKASIMLAGIYSDTGNFTFSSTSPIDFLAAAYLTSMGANVEIVKHYLPLNLSAKDIDTLEKLKNNLSLRNIYGNLIGITELYLEEYMPDIAHIVSELLSITGLSSVIAIVNIKENTFLIGRSSSDSVDVSRIMSHFGGGGHRKAASATIKGKTIPEIKEKLLSILYSCVEPVKTISDIMTFPVKMVNEGKTVLKVNELLKRYALNAMPVVNENGKLLGIVDREIVDKAISMGLGNEDVSKIARKNIQTLYPNQSIGKAELLIAKEHQILVPIVDRAGRIVGVVTRTDILSNVHEGIENLKRRASKRNILRLLKQRVPKNVFGLLMSIGKLADSINVNVYVIGGFVRDLIIGRKNLDVDIVVEGKAEKLAKLIAVKMNAKVHSFKRFGTVRLVFPNGFKIDMASARTEIYRSPGALPEVSDAPLKKDLFRRDFTINTLAIKLNERSFGTLIDFFGGLRDIREKKIRVLHSLSFVEDPTRILRALRFAVRYRFKLGKYTERLIKDAVERNAFKNIEGQRLYLEIKHILEEDNPLRIINKMDSYGILKSIEPEITWNKEKRDLFEGIRKLLIWYRLSFPNLKVNSFVIYFSALTSNLNTDDLKKLMKSLAVPETELKLVESVRKSMRIIERNIKPDMLNSKAYEILKRLTTEAILYAVASKLNPKIKSKLLAYLKSWRFISPAISGRDLIQLDLPTGPIFKTILMDVKHKILDGQLSDRESQISYVKKRYV